MTESDDAPELPEAEAPVTPVVPARRYRPVLVSGVCHGVIEEDAE
jgi:hypothetical protein